MTTTSLRCDDGGAVFACRCGAVGGVISAEGRATANRVVCCCDDCQAFAHRLGRADLLDAHGGSDIVQVAPATMTFTRGEAHVVGLRLSPKGLFRWYADCCATPLGNTVGPALPFVGIVAAAFRADGRPIDALFGPPVATIMARSAIGGPPPGAAPGVPFGLMARTIWKVLGWRLRGLAWPHPFFDRATAAPSRPVSVLTREERDALRPLCGPTPAR